MKMYLALVIIKEDALRVSVPSVGDEKTYPVRLPGKSCAISPLYRSLADLAADWGANCDYQEMFLDLDSPPSAEGGA